MGENLRICRWPFDMDNVSVHQDGKLCRRPDTNATAAGRNSSDKAGSPKPSQHSDAPNATPNSLVKVRACFSIEGIGMCLPACSLFRAKPVTRRGVRKVYQLLPWKSLFRGE